MAKTFASPTLSSSSRASSSSPDSLSSRTSNTSAPARSDTKKKSAPQQGTHLPNTFGNSPVHFHLHVDGESWPTFEFQITANGYRIGKTPNSTVQNYAGQQVDTVQGAGRPVEQAEQKDKSFEELERRIKDLEKESEKREHLRKEREALKKREDDLEKERDYLISKIDDMETTHKEQLSTKDKKVEKAEGEQKRIAARNLNIRNGMVAETSNLRELSNLEDQKDEKGRTVEEDDNLQVERLKEAVTKTKEVFENQKQKLSDKNAEIDRYQEQITELKNTADQAAEAQAQNDNLRKENQTLNTRIQDIQNLNDNLQQENQTLKTQLQGFQTLQSQLEERNVTITSLSLQIRRLQILSTIQQFRKNVLIQKCNQLQQQYNDISRERDEMRQQNETLALKVDGTKNDYEVEIGYLLYQMCTCVEPMDLSSFSQEIIKLDETPSTEANLPVHVPIQHPKHRARKSTGRRSRARNNSSMRLARNRRGTFLETMARNGLWRERAKLRR